MAIIIISERVSRRKRTEERAFFSHRGIALAASSLA